MNLEQHFSKSFGIKKKNYLKWELISSYLNQAWNSRQKFVFQSKPYEKCIILDELHTSADWLAPDTGVLFSANELFEIDQLVHFKYNVLKKTKNIDYIKWFQDSSLQENLQI